MAQMGERVLLIDADMRRHNLHKVFSIENVIGISDMVVDHDNVEAGTRDLSHIPNLSVITGGTLAPNPSELLGSNSMRDLMAKFRKQYDRIILDSPPLLAFSDALVLSRLADGALFVIWGGVTRRDAVKKTTQAIQGVNGKVLGVVLNNISASWNSSSHEYYPYYEHYYGSEAAEQKKQG
jgi:capsular exopolysaccharide synthesis family protein